MEPLAAPGAPAAVRGTEAAVGAAAALPTGASLVALEEEIAAALVPPSIGVLAA